MVTVKLGSSRVEVSALCLGAMYYGGRVGDAESFALLDQYLEAGGNFIDTANIYAWWVEGGQGGESETLLRRWMKARNNRSSLFLASKVGFQYGDVARGLRAEQIVNECDKSLQRLGVEMIDLYYAHVDDRETPMEETLEAFSRLASAGKIRFIGASNFAAWRLERASWLSRADGWPEYCCIQQRYTYLRKKPGATFEPQVAVSEELLDFCRAVDLPILAYSPLLGGAYTRADRQIPAAYLGPDSEARLEALQAVADEVAATRNQVILAWMLQSAPAVVPVFSASTPDQMRENLGVLDVKLSDDQMTRLNDAGA